MIMAALDDIQTKIKTLNTSVDKLIAKIKYLENEVNLLKINNNDLKLIHSQVLLDARQYLEELEVIKQQLK